MKTITLNLFGGRIDSAKFALNLAIKNFKDMGQSNMAIIYEDMLEDIIKAESELSKDEEDLTTF